MRTHGLRFAITGLLLLSSLGFLCAQEEFTSGPAVGKSIPGSIQAFNLNGRKGRDRFHCMVCDFQLNPVVLIFVREGPGTDSMTLQEFLQRVNDKVKKYHKTNSLSGVVIFVTPDAKSAGTEGKIDDPDELIKECQKRTQLEERLRTQYRDFMGPLYPETLSAMIGERAALWVEEQVNELHPVVIAYAANGPPGFNVSAQPGVTVVLYRKLKVEQVLAFADGKLDEAAVGQVLKGVDTLVKGAAVKKKG